MKRIKKYISLLCLFLAISASMDAKAEFISSWAAGNYKNISEAGILCHSVIAEDLKGNITRKEMCELAMALYDCWDKDAVWDKMSFSDCDNEAVLKAYGLGIVSGVNDTEFEPGRAVTREEMSKILVKTLIKAEVPVNLSVEDKKLIDKFSDKDEISPWAENAVIFLVKNDIISGISEDMLMPSENTTREQAIVIIDRIYSKFCENKNIFKIPEITSAVSDNGISIVWDEIDGSNMYRVILKNNNGLISDIITFDNSVLIKNSDIDNEASVVAEAVGADGKSVFSMPYEFLNTKEPEKAAPAVSENVSPKKEETDWDEYIDLDKIGEVNEKEYKNNRVFNGGEPFTDEKTAMENMTDIEVDVWNITHNGEKRAGKMTITVNKNLADDVKSIFKEIFEGEEKFPIKSCSGYSWRNSSSGRLSQHSYGTCIDINPNENYYISSSGEILSGSYWKPYEDPYSITAEGEVVKIFEKYGFAWGATAWGEGHARDYMHFTYLGN